MTSMPKNLATPSGTYSATALFPKPSAATLSPEMCSVTRVSGAAQGRTSTSLAAQGRSLGRELFQRLRYFAEGQAALFVGDVLRASVERLSRPSLKQMDLAYFRAYAKGDIPRFYSELAPQGREYFLERMVPVVGWKRARELELAAMLEIAYPDADKDTLMAKVDMGEQLPVIAKMRDQIDELERRGIDEEASWQWFQGSKLVEDHSRQNFRNSLRVLKEQIAALRSFIERTLQEGEMSYARMTQIRLGYIEFVESVNYRGGGAEGFRFLSREGLFQRSRSGISPETYSRKI